MRGTGDVRELESTQRIGVRGARNLLGRIERPRKTGERVLRNVDLDRGIRERAIGFVDDDAGEIHRTRDDEQVQLAGVARLRQAAAHRRVLVTGRDQHRAVPIENELENSLASTVDQIVWNASNPDYTPKDLPSAYAEYHFAVPSNRRAGWISGPPLDFVATPARDPDTRTCPSLLIAVMRHLGAYARAPVATRTTFQQRLVQTLRLLEAQV